MHFQLQNENLGVSRIIGSENVACVPAQKGGEGGEGAPATNTHIVIGPQMSTNNQSEISREAYAFLHDCVHVGCILCNWISQSNFRVHERPRMSNNVGLSPFKTDSRMTFITYT